MNEGLGHVASICDLLLKLVTNEKNEVGSYFREGAREAFFFFFLFRATPTAYGGSQARG